MNIRGEALNQLEQFVKNNLSLYATERNFDYGPQKRTNTSNLSKYITHRVIDEEEVIPSPALMIGQKNCKNMDIYTIIPGCGLLAFGFLP
jgi:deoxyribodipyrimidine photolyase